MFTRLAVWDSYEALGKKDYDCRDEVLINMDYLRLAHVCDGVVVLEMTHTLGKDALEYTVDQTSSVYTVYKTIPEFIEAVQRFQIKIWG